MNPLRLTAENYRSYRDLSIEFVDGVTAIIGANGAGKSSIVDAIEYALFGGKHASQITKDSDHPMRLELAFEHGGKTYSIKRSYSSGGRGKATLEFFRFGAGGPADFEPLTRESTKATQEAIEEVVGFTRATWRASSFLAQGDGAAFTEADPRDRKAILAEAVLGRDPIWPRLLATARVRRAELAEEYAGLNVAVQRATTDLLELPDRTAKAHEHQKQIGILEAAIKVLEVQEQEHVAKLAGIEEQARARAAILERQKAAKTLLDTLEETETAGAEALAVVDELDEQIAAATALVEEARSIREAQAETARLNALRANVQAERDRALQEVAAVRKTLQEVEEKPTLACPTCKRPLDDASRADSIAELSRILVQRTEYADAIVVPDPEPEPPALTPAHTEAVQRLTELQGRRAVAGERIAAVAAEGFQARIADARAEVLQIAAEGEHIMAADTEAYDAATNALDETRQDLDKHRRQLAATSEWLGAASQDVFRLQALKTKTEADESKIVALTGMIERYTVLEQAYSQNGIPALLIENTAIPQIEAEANRILDELGGTAVGVQLHTLREKKSGDGLTDALDIVVSTETGQRDYETFSGGERCRVNLSLRVALAALLAARRGAESQILVIDEPDGLDEAGFSALLRVLEGLTGTFRKILVVSHHPELRDSIEQTIMVEKRESSRVAGEEVAA